jgi:hypothetical protein
MIQERRVEGDCRPNDGLVVGEYPEGVTADLKQVKSSQVNQGFSNPST